MAVLNFTDFLHLPLWATADNIPPLLAALSEENATLDRVIKSLVEKSENYPAIMGMLEAINETMAAALERIDRNEAAIAVLHPDEVRGMRETIQALEEKVKANADNIATFNIRLQDMEACCETVTGRLDELDVEVEKITADIVTINETITELDTRVSAELDEVRARLDRVETWERRILILEKNMDAALIDIAKNAENISTNAEIILNHEDRITALEDGEGGGLADVKSQIAEVLSTADAIEAEISIMRDDIQTNADGVSTNAGNIVILGDKVEANRSNLNHYEGVVDENTERVDGVEAITTEHARTLADHSDLIMSNSAGVARNAAEIDEIKDRLTDAEDEIDNRVKLV